MDGESEEGRIPQLSSSRKRSGLRGEGNQPLPVPSTVVDVVSAHDLRSSSGRNHQVLVCLEPLVGSVIKKGRRGSSPAEVKSGGGGAVIIPERDRESICRALVAHGILNITK